MFFGISFLSSSFLVADNTTSTSSMYESDKYMVSDFNLAIVVSMERNPLDSILIFPLYFPFYSLVCNPGNELQAFPDSLYLTAQSLRFGNF